MNIYVFQFEIRFFRIVEIRQETSGNTYYAYFLANKSSELAADAASICALLDEGWGVSCVGGFVWRLVACRQLKLGG